MKIAIVTTHKIECGIARFSEILYKGLSMEDEVTIFELPPHELKKSFGATKDGADRFISDVCEKLKHFDAVSIQCEYSLFADSVPISVARIKKILASNPNSTITFHTIINRGSSADAEFPPIWRWLLSPKSTARHFFHGLRTTMMAKEELKLFDFIRNSKIKIIVHTETTKSILKHRFRLVNVDCHPLCYTSEAEKTEFDHTECRQELVDRLQFQPTDRLVGVFGFFGGYKGFDYAIKCIARLPQEYKLLVFSGLHPNLIKHSDTSQIDQLIELAKKNKVLNRVFFMGSVDDLSMYRAVAGVDFSWLPYREVGQEASAICSEVAELSQRMLVSRNFAFVDYMKFKLRKEFEFVEIGNIEELRLKTVNYDRFHSVVPGSEPVKNHAELQSDFYRGVLNARAI